MALPDELTDRERRVLEAVIQSYVADGGAAGSRDARRGGSGSGVSPATIRNTMSDLEEKGFLFHPHTSAGRVPTDKAYRAYVDSLMHVGAGSTVADRARAARASRSRGGGSAIETILRRAAQTLGVLTQELGVALGPRLDAAVLRRLELVRLASDRLLMVLTLDGGVVRTIFVEVPGEIADERGGRGHARAERAARRAHAATRSARRSPSGCATRDATADADGAAQHLRRRKASSCSTRAAAGRRAAWCSARPSLLAEQPEFAGGRAACGGCSSSPRRAHAARRRCCAQRGRERRASRSRSAASTAIRASSRSPSSRRSITPGALTGVIGVIGPTRMPYEKVISLVQPHVRWSRPAH